jgi:hypothetical protein
MNNLEIYIVYHNQEAFELFQKNNKHIDTSKFKFILVGDYNQVGGFNYDEHIISSFELDNIEQQESLLTFTAWYMLIKNGYHIKTDYVGIFEYDCVFKEDIFKVEKFLKDDSFIGFSPRMTSEKLYLDLIPEFCALLNEEEINKAKQKSVWNATTNVILPVQFLKSFVLWYEKFIPLILRYPKHSHFHERAVNIFAANADMNYSFFVSWIEHKKLNSHYNKLQK